MCKRYFGKVKSLLHFDFPYFNEPNDGLDDEVRETVWTKVTDVLLTGKRYLIDRKKTQNLAIDAYVSSLLVLRKM